MPRKPEYTGVSIKEEFAQSVEDFIEEHPTLGYRSLAQFIEDATRRRLEELKAQYKALPRFDRINGDATGVLIYDHELKDVKGNM
jgi:metal-responsive CopG/Arc/MetJ family transcriptional regulator